MSETDSEQWVCGQCNQLNSSWATECGRCGGKKDIIERLRNRIHDSHLDTERLIDEAADEIERLREQLTAAVFSDSEECKFLNAENERLRTALTDIASDRCSRSGAVGIAKDALAGKTQEQWS